MTKRIQKRFNETPLDSYEKELKEFLDKGEYDSLSKPALKKENAELQEAARRYFNLKKSKSITLRVKNEKLIKFKAKAKGKGVPYQRIINSFIEKYADDKIKFAT